MRLHFFRRILSSSADETGGPPRSLLGREYATTEDERELLSTGEGEAQEQNRWEVGCLMCRISVEQLGDGRCALVAESQSRVDALLSDLEAGMPLDDAVRKHAAS